MTSPMAFAGSHVVAVGLAVAAAVLFGLAAVRQHGVAQASTSSLGRGLRGEVSGLLRLVRTPSWLIGAAQGLTGGGLHIIALALAPIAVVQPIGVLAVPVTVVASAVRHQRRPSPPQLAGALVSVISIAVLTLLLLTPGAADATVPSLARLVVTVTLVLAATVGLGTIARVGAPLVRCVCLAIVAAVLFGLTSAIIQLITRIVADTPGAHRSVLIAAAASLVLTIPTGIWALQTAYTAGTAQVVICCTTLIDPVTAVVGGAWLLRERYPLDPIAIVGVICCAGLTAVAVVLLSGGPTDVLDVMDTGAAPPLSGTAAARPTHIPTTPGSATSPCPATARELAPPPSHRHPSRHQKGVQP